jgi:hypothetical protein
MAYRNKQNTGTPKKSKKIFVIISGRDEDSPGLYHSWKTAQDHIQGIKKSSGTIVLWESFEGKHKESDALLYWHSHFRDPPIQRGQQLPLRNLQQTQQQGPHNLQQPQQAPLHDYQPPPPSKSNKSLNTILNTPPNKSKHLLLKKRELEVRHDTHNNVQNPNTPHPPPTRTATQRIGDNTGHKTTPPSYTRTLNNRHSKRHSLTAG